MLIIGTKMTQVAGPEPPAGAVAHDRQPTVDETAGDHLGVARVDIGQVLT
jgi:hypothetical protein